MNAARAHRAGQRWQTSERQGVSHREAGSAGGKSRRWAPPRPAGLRQEVVGRWLIGEASQVELAREYNVSRSTVRRWCAEAEESGV